MQRIFQIAELVLIYVQRTGQDIARQRNIVMDTSDF